MRVVQPLGTRGSLKWIQRAINERRNLLDAPILAEMQSTAEIEWRSPLAIDEDAEYRDAAFLERIGCLQLATSLAKFWPARGPQWDALGLTNRREAILVEAKAHIDEIFFRRHEGRISVAGVD
jgi:hypothetical protein